MKNWPTPQEYNEAIQTPQLCFSDPDLRKTKIALNSMGLPKSASGAFASVYKATTGSTSWAVRCFLSNRPEQSARYKHISDFVLFDNLDSTVDFHYLTEGVQVKGQWYPCLKMVWVEGPTLDQYVESNYKDSAKMTELLKSFHQMVGELEGAGIGHGDLQHGNIIVSNQGLRLVDYDALFVPALAGLKSLEFGHPNYQHPERTEHHYDPDIDHFSCWLIHASLLAIAIDPTLYRSLGGGDDSLLFKRKDLVDPDNSATFAALLSHDSDHIRETTNIVRRMLWEAPNKIPYLGAPAELLETLPRERPTKSVVADAATQDTETSGSTAEGSNLQNADAKNWYDDPGHYDSTPAPLNFSSAYDAIAASNVERKLERKKPATRLRQLTEGTFRAGVDARDRIKKLAEKLEQSTLRTNWINRKYTEAYRLFEHGEYEKASKIFLEIFKQLDEQKSGKTYFEIALVLGSALALAGNSALAGNYFVVAYNYARRQMEALILPRAGLALALSKFEESETAAWKFLDDNPRSLLFLSETINEDMSNPFFARTVTFRMLRDYSVRMIEQQNFLADAFSDALSDAVDSAWIVLWNIMQSDAHFNDETLINSFISLAGQLLVVGKAARAKDLLFNLADCCDSHGFQQHSKIAKFCAATLLNTSEGQEAAALGIISSLGHMSGDDLTSLATTSSAFIEQDSILELLLDVCKTFEQLDSRGEAEDALQVACRFSLNCNDSCFELIVPALERFSNETICRCLNESYLHPDCNSTKKTAFIRAVSGTSHKRVQEAVVDYYALHQEVVLLADLLEILSTRADAHSFSQILAGNNLAARAIIKQASDISIQRICAYLEECRSPIPPGDFASFPWHRYTGSITALDNFRVLFIFLEDDERSENLLSLLASDQLCEMVDHWFIQIVAASNFDRYYRFAQALADHSQVGVLERLISHLVRQGHSIVVDGITKNLTLKNHLLLLIELSENLASKGNLDAFAQVSKEVAKSAQVDELIQTIDKLVESNHEQTEFVVTLLKRMLEHNQANKASVIIKHLHKINELSYTCGLANTVIYSSFHQSLFDELLRQEDLSTVGALTACLAAEMKTEGVTALYSNLKEGGVSDHTVSKILSHSFDELMHQLDQLVDQTETLAMPTESLDKSGRKLVKALNLALQSLHYLRSFIARRQNKGVQHIFVGMTDKVSETLDAKYDSLVAVWCLQLARQKNQELLNATALTMMTFKKENILSLTVEHLIGNQLPEALYGISSYLVNNDEPEAAFKIALTLAKDNVFEAKTITTQILKYTTSEPVLISLLKECAEVNDRLADMLVRQLATRGAGILKSMAYKLANSGDEKALAIVLSQLVATDEQFIAFITSLVNSLTIDVAIIGNWLAEAGMTSVIQQQITFLTDSGDLEKADSWSKFLAEIDAN